MAAYLVRRIVWEEAEIDEADLITQTEAVELLGVAMSTVRSEAECGRLTLIADQGRCRDAWG